jgi:hypothetical protein
MGYDFYITRKKNILLDENGPAITPEEWLALINSDPELTLDDPDTEPYFAVWSGPGEYPCWIDYDPDLGSLFSESPTDEFLEKMDQLAVSLNGTVQGEAGEIYRSDGILEGTWIKDDDQQWHLA